MDNNLPPFGPVNGGSRKFVPRQLSDNDASSGVIITTDIGPTKLQGYLTRILLVSGCSLDTTLNDDHNIGSSWHPESTECMPLITTVSVVLLAPEHYHVDIHVLLVAE